MITNFCRYVNGLLGGNSGTGIYVEGGKADGNRTTGLMAEIYVSLGTNDMKAAFTGTGPGTMYTAWQLAMRTGLKNLMTQAKTCNVPV